MLGRNPIFQSAVRAWKGDYSASHDLWIAAAQATSPRLTGYEYFIQQYLLQGAYPVIPETPPVPDGYALLYEDYRKITPGNLLGVTHYKGRIPVGIMLEVDPAWPFYYFARRRYKKRLTVFTPRQVDYSVLFGAQWVRVRSCIAAWAGLNEEAKDQYRADPEAKARGITGWQLFQSRNQRA